MSNLKITELPQSNSLDGTEILAVVQDGVTKKATINNIQQLYGVSQTLQDGDTYNMLQSGKFYDIHILNWAGAGGNQNATVILPDVSDSGRIIRIITKGGFTSNTHANLTPKAGQTIDGGNLYVINKPYEGVAIYSDGTEWIVVQAKAH